MINSVIIKTFVILKFSIADVLLYVTPSHVHYNGHIHRTACGRHESMTGLDRESKKHAALYLGITVNKRSKSFDKKRLTGAHSPVKGHPRGSKVVPLNSWGRVSY